MKTNSKSARIRQRLSHPVIDSDGHSTDFSHLFDQYLRDVAGEEVFRRSATNADLPFLGSRWYKASPQQRRDEWIPRPGWWGVPAGNALDLATAQIPKLLYERLPEAGLDVTVLYAGKVFIQGMINDEELRRASCRASNLLHRDLYQDYSDRIIPVAAVPAHTPEEAIEELEFCVRELGYRAFTMPSYIKRPIPKYKSEFPRACWIDTYGIDSEYDYDPLWRKCLELKVVPTFHSSSQGAFFRASISNFTYNHIGHFAQSAEAVCKSLFLGGVTRRFPGLNFAFLEGGASWGTTLLSDLVGHWKKRNVAALERVNPARLDPARYAELCETYAGSLLGNRLSSEQRSMLARTQTTAFEEDPARLDEFERVGLSSVEEMHDLFVKPFFFGCEGDDPMTGVAFDTKRNPLHAKLNAIFGSDIGHFDVPEIAEVLEETYEAVEHGLMTEQEFHDFVFANPIKLWTSVNPDFFKGTVVEDHVAKARLAN